MNSNTLRQLQNPILLQIRNFNLHRYMSTGTRGARGHGWLHKYRAGEGGRHLQGRFHQRDVDKLTSINNQVFDLNHKFSKSDGDNTNVLPLLAYLDFAIQGEDDGVYDKQGQQQQQQKQQHNHRVIIELASVALPNTCRNFIELCQADQTQEKVPGGEYVYGYKKSQVFRILPQVGLCLGDTISNTGKQGKCSPTISPTGTFPDEPTVISHSQKGIVSMLSTGVDKNDSRFMIMTAEDAPHLDGRFVAFGRVKEGIEILEDIVENTYTKKGVPSVNIQVVDCGVL